jgi:acetolactate synthase-1/2/3 large subunit
MNASEALVQALENHGVDFVFGLPGVHNLPIFDALRSSSRIRTITVRNESAASFMASGYARTLWKLGVCLFAPGPGVTNAMTGIAEAYVDSTPLLILSGGVQRSTIGKGTIHEVEHQPLLASITKWCGRADRFNEVLPLLEKTFSEAVTGRPRPTFLEIPLDVQSSQGEPKALKPISEAQAAVDQEKARLASKLLLEAEHPVIIAGGGVLSAQATTLVRALSEKLGIPVATTITAKDVVPDASPLSLGLLNDEVAWKVVPQADVLLALGCRFAQRSTSSWSLRINGRLIHVDIDPAEIGKNYPASLGIVGDVGDFLDMLLKEVEGHERRIDAEWLEEIGALKAARNARYEGKLTSDEVPLKPQRVMRELSEALEGEVVVTFDSGNNAWWPMMFLESREGRRFLFPSGNVSMGFSLPAALGARCVTEKVVSVTGDGGLMMQLAELATAVQEGLDVTVLVLNDGGYGAIRHYQRFNFGERYIGVDFRNPDLGKVAEAFGAEGIRVETPRELANGLRKALHTRRVTVLDVRIDPEEVALPDWIIKSFRGGKA